MIYEILNQYYSALHKEKHHRYKSWEHCYKFFRTHRTIISEEQKDHAMLNLAFYLASWGMYRGSSFLLQKDYKVHRYALDILLKEKYSKLWNWNIEDKYSLNEYVELLFSLKKEIVSAYEDNINIVNGVLKKINITDTLVTKILLGTYGCSPAYDQYFVKGLKFHGIEQCTFNKNSFYKLVKFYNVFKEDFDRFQEKTRCDGLEYPIMKLLDMYFWQVGYWLDIVFEDGKTVNFFKDIREKYNEALDIEEKFKINKNTTIDIKPNELERFTLPDNLKGKSIHSKVIPTVCNLKNLLEKLVEVHGDEAKFKQWELRSYKGYNIKEIKFKILNSERDKWKQIIRNHIISNPIHVFGANITDIYLVAYVSENYGIGKENFFKYIRNAGITEKHNSIQAIWQVGKGDGTYLGILNEDGSVKDWNFINCWING
ncbi:hypothetical protein [Clostridium ganghwense]|uniref:Uncharacterized protein n=1 Tax=Clostridium ganghwense TaxID=312089 RepID=A0ABT4CMT3_9CLOT|nr:hypothetical protein [Clostridium ganghwense]MCY6369406.1 hypothetical protein [Clostridium ganghwense]